MKPFDLKEAKAGKPVCTRDGKPVRILCFNMKTENDQKIVALIDKGDYETIAHYYRNGQLLYSTQNDADLMMTSEKREGWINIKKIGDDDVPYAEGVFVTEQQAKAMFSSSCESHIATLKIEWEE